MKVVVNKTRLNFIDVGDSGAIPVVLIHGFPLNHEMWNPQIDFLKRNFRAVVYDIRGHGDSDVEDGLYTIEFFVDDLIGLMDHLKIEKAVLCGLSMGGYISLRAAERNPERLQALILCDTKAEADSNEAKLKRAASIRSIKDEGLGQFAESQVRSLLAPQTFNRSPTIVETIRKMILRNSPLGICGALLAMAGRTDTTVTLPKIKVPTLILVGEQDTLTPPPLSKAMYETIPNSKIHIIPEAAHLSNLENPSRVQQAFQRFLGKPRLTPQEPRENRPTGSLFFGLKEQLFSRFRKSCLLQRLLSWLALQRRTLMMR